eukprot:TRINITY_DN14149_c0_g1_i2.p2 TRINITY_DN14149_c0_g1~~TRINITY_DN14149_c0_g1_i2.p2  ORF type:complete len:109 (+),score=30.80 TRINITY_DN14149_c0_g1_i2:124-450(+)
MCIRDSSEGALDAGLIGTLREKCLEYLEKNGSGSKIEIGLFVRSLGLTSAMINDEDIQKVLDALFFEDRIEAVSYTHLRAHETSLHLVCRLLLEKKKKKPITPITSDP